MKTVNLVGGVGLIATCLACGGGTSALPTSPDREPKTTSERISSEGDVVSAAIPSGAGWNCLHNHQTEGELQVWFVKCRMEADGEFFFMMAKDYVVPDGQTTPSQTLITEVSPKNYQKIFTEHTIEDVESVDHQGHAGHQYMLKAVHASKGAIHKWERVVVMGAHTFNISAEGAPAEFEKYASERELWLESATFAELK